MGNLEKHDDDLNSAALENLYGAVSHVIETAQSSARTAINYSMVRSNYEIGRLLVEGEQEGTARAKYGSRVIEKLSARLTEKYGRGCSVENLRLMRRVFLVYSKDKISQSASTESRESPLSKGQVEQSKITQDTFFISSEQTLLSWSHYVMPMRIDDPNERRFYEIEARKNQWGLKELQRQFNSSLCERLALSQDKKALPSLLMPSPRDGHARPHTSSHAT